MFNAYSFGFRCALLVAMFFAPHHFAFTDEPKDGIEAALARPDSWDFEKTPLASVLATIGKKTNLPIICDTAALEQQWIDLEQISITHQSQAEPLAATLDALLTANSLTWIKRHDVLLITTPEAAAERYSQVQLYKVIRKVAPARRVDTIRSSIAPPSWAVSGGKGDITPLPPSFIVISQSPMIHRQITKAFASSVTPIAGQRAERFGSVELDKAFLAPAELHAKAESPLRLLKQLVKENNLGLAIHEAALKESQIELDHLKLTLDLHRGPRISSILSLVLELSHPDLTWTAQGKTALITTRSALTKLPRKKTYDVRELIDKVDGKYLVEAIEYNVHASTWEFGGGEGKVELTERGKLEVEQSEFVLRELEQLLGDLRYGLSDRKEKE